MSGRIYYRNGFTHLLRNLSLVAFKQTCGAIDSYENILSVSARHSIKQDFIILNNIPLEVFESLHT